MAIGPVQLIVLGFSHPDFHGEIIAELERLRESDTVRVIDSLAVYKDADGDLEVEHLSNLSTDEAIELGSKIGALIGLGIDGEEGAEERGPDDGLAPELLLHAQRLEIEEMRNSAEPVPESVRGRRPRHDPAGRAGDVNGGPAGIIEREAVKRPVARRLAQGELIVRHLLVIDD